ncbi:Hypothetical predicted protein [Octopus vulgaris]|uniref:Uncharacterized protein n=1 Tax=Octopus vulgaris TaxID=6645 RepID=A0AA36AHR3_OCTVU|nr:Hypothetical predicted protein [Octopus vulgaris]
MDIFQVDYFTKFIESAAMLTWKSTNLAKMDTTFHIFTIRGKIFIQPRSLQSYYIDRKIPRLAFSSSSCFLTLFNTLPLAVLF